MKKSAGDIIILQTCTKNHNHDVWFLRYGVGQTELFILLDHFLPLNDFLPLHICTINDNHMMYST